MNSVMIYILSVCQSLRVPRDGASGHACEGLLDRLTELDGPSLQVVGLITSGRQIQSDLLPPLSSPPR